MERAGSVGMQRAGSVGPDDFMKEVRDNFLICQLCKHDFNRPKTLPCLHTFCQGCLLKYAEESRHTYRYTTYCKPINCPVCQKRTDVTKNDIENLPDNFLISSLSGIIRDKRRDITICDICSRRTKGGRRPTAVQHCIDCDKQLCKRCVSQHLETKVTQHHSLYSLDQADKLMCTEHQDEAVRFICKSCATCVCIYCTYTSHKDHDLVSIVEGTENYQHEIEKTMESCDQRIKNLSTKLKFIQTWEQCYNQTREHILSTATDFLTQVESQRQAFLQRLDNMYGPEVLEMLRKKGELIESLEGLSSAFKYKDSMPKNQTIEAVLIQSELQNKVRQLLETPLPVPDDLPINEEMTISFEKGGVRLGSLIKQDGEEEPIYYDGDELEGDSSWCRQCRARSRSPSLMKEMKNFKNKDANGRAHSLTPFISDTDLSLTDVSAIDNMSPQFMRFDSQNCDSIGSDIDKICETAEFGVQVELPIEKAEPLNAGLRIAREGNPITITSSTQYDLPSDITYQHAAELKHSSAETAKLKYCDSCTQYDTSGVCSTVGSSTQHEYSCKDSVTQCQPNMTNTSTQHECVLAESGCQATSTYQTSSTQSEILTADVGVSCRPSQSHKVVGTSRINMKNTSTMTPVRVTTETGSGDPMDLPYVTMDSFTNTERRKLADKYTTANLFVDKTERGVMTECLPCRDTATYTSDLISLTDTSTDAYTNSGYSRFTQTVESSRIDQFTNTPIPPMLTDNNTNTEVTDFADQVTQTINVRYKSRGVVTHPDTNDFSVDVKPATRHKSISTWTLSCSHSDTQTDRKLYKDNSTNTFAIQKKTRGTVAQVESKSNETTTRDLLQTATSCCQTFNPVIVDSGVGDANVFEFPKPEIAMKESATTLCGTDIPFTTESKGTDTDTLQSLLRKHVAVSTSIPKRDSWCNPLILSTSTKACGTDIRRRHVGLTVHPSAKDNSTNTYVCKTTDQCLGDGYALTKSVGVGNYVEVSTSQTSTGDLLCAIDSETNTEVLEGKKVELSTQTQAVITCDNYTLMSESYLKDKSTNTPSQLPADVYANFKHSEPIEMLNRAIQTELNQNQLLQKLSTADVDPSEDRSMLTTNPSYSARPHPLIFGSGEFPESLPHVNRPLLAKNPYNSMYKASGPPSSRKFLPNSLTSSKPKYSSISTSAKPSMRDQSTSTATLSALLHTERLSSDCMDNKISECITKLRLVTKKLQNSSTDISRSQHSATSSCHMDTDNSTSDSVSSFIIPSGGSPNKESHAFLDLSSPVTQVAGSNTAIKIYSNKPKLTEAAQQKTTPNSSGFSNVSSPQSSQQLAQCSDAETIPPVLTLDSPSLESVTLSTKLDRGFMRLQPIKHDSITLNAFKIPPVSTTCVEKMVRSYSKHTSTVLQEPGICYAKLVNSTQQGEGQQQNGDHMILVTGDSVTSNVSTQSSSSTPRKQRLQPKKKWDLKSLVHEEDLQQKQSKPRERYNTIDRKNDSSCSVDSLEPPSRTSSQMSVSGSLKSSSESLNKLLAGRGVRKAPQVKLKTQQNRKSRTNASFSLQTPSTSSATNKRVTPNKNKSVAGVSTSDKRPLRKNRSRATENASESPMNGSTHSYSGSSSSEKSLKKPKSTKSSKSLVSTVVKKVQSMGKQKPIPNIQYSVSENELSQSSMSDKNLKGTSSNESLVTVAYPSEACAERLANHSLLVPSMEQPFGLSPRLKPRNPQKNKSSSAKVSHKTKTKDEKSTKKPVWL